MGTQWPLYAQISVEDCSTGQKRLPRRVPLLNSEGNAVETVPQAIAELNRLRTKRADDELPWLGRTPTFAKYAEDYLLLVVGYLKLPFETVVEPTPRGGLFRQKVRLLASEGLV